MRIHWMLVALVISPSMARAQELLPELAWVPPSSTAFVHLRFADLWDSAIGKGLRGAFEKSDPKMLTEIESNLGISLSEVATLTIVLPEVLDRGPTESLVLRVTTREPYDPKRVLNALGVENRNERDTSVDRKLYSIRGRAMLHFSDAKSLTIVSGRDGAVAMLGRLLESRGTGGLSPALKKAVAKHHLVAAMDVSHFRHLQNDEVPAKLRPLFDGKLAVVTGDLHGDQAEFALNIGFDRPGLARDAVDAIHVLKRELLDELDLGRRELAGSKENAARVKMIEVIATMVKSVTIEARESTVVASAKLATSDPLAILAKEGVDAIQISSARSRSANNLKQIGLAMHNYYDVNRSLPPAAICDKNGKPLLSWRVLILPYLEQDNLYRQFKLDEPWDSEHNMRLAANLPKTYVLPGDKTKHQIPSTYYRVFVGNDAMFQLRKGRKFAEIMDGLSNTLMVVESDAAVPWTKPDDMTYDPKVAPKLSLHFGGANALFGDGSVRFLKKTLKTETLHLLIQRNDGMPVMID